MRCLLQKVRLQTIKHDLSAADGFLLQLKCRANQGSLQEPGNPLAPVMLDMAIGKAFYNSICSRLDHSTTPCELPGDSCAT